MSKERELLRLLSSEMFESGLDREWKLHIKDLLAQPEAKQELVGFIKYGRSICWTTQAHCLKTGDLLYTSPQKREALSEKEIADLWWNNYVGTAESVRNFARAIEKAHGIGVGSE